VFAVKAAEADTVEGEWWVMWKDEGVGKGERRS